MPIEQKLLRKYTCTDGFGCALKRKRVFWVLDTESGMNDDLDQMLSCPWCDGNCWPDKEQAAVRFTDVT